MLCKTNLSMLTILLILALIQAGCSISDSVSASSESVSTILTSPSTSSASSGDDDEETAKIELTTTLYEEDIAALTVLYLRHEKNDNEFKRQLGEIAKGHGINDWEQEVSTFKAMGIGLKRAGIGEKSILEIPYFKTLSDENYQCVVEGYQY